MQTHPLHSLVLALIAGAALAANGADVPDQLVGRESAMAKIHPGLRNPGGEANVIIRLADPPLAAVVGPRMRQGATAMTANQQVAYSRSLRNKQAPVVQVIQNQGGRLVGQLTAGINAVLATVKTDVLPEIASFGQVSAIRPVIDYTLDLSSTVPHIGAGAAQAAGVTGDGIRVAVLDSGVDYTHRNLGGPGTLEAYEAAYGASTADLRNTTRDGLFPTSKVIGGFDFVGEDWPNTPEVFDEDPIDFQGHGTHVADIIAGSSVDGLHKGVAPDAKLYSFKVCSAVSTACSGFAIFLGLDACLHPDNPADFLGPIVNPVDAVNLSLGAPYGQIQDDSAAMVQLLAEIGVTVVTSAGNSGDLPYIAGSPSIAPAAISVAQTTVPGAKAYKIAVRGGPRRTPLGDITNTADIDWAPLDHTVYGFLVAVGRGCPGDAYPDGTDLADKVALIDRGACAISEKVDRAARAGAIGVILANNVPGDPPSFSLGAGSEFVPTLVVTQDAGVQLKSQLVTWEGLLRVLMQPRSVTSLAQSIVATSSRGPSFSFQTIKPEIGAPGASISAEVGTGTGETPFGGTSGAAPMVTGAAALVQSYLKPLWGFTPPAEVVKALLMNNAEPIVYQNPAALGKTLTPITRTGAGEVRVDRALSSGAMAVTEGPSLLGIFADVQPSLSFGYHGATRPFYSSTKEVKVWDLSGSARTFNLSSDFRFADDSASGAVSLVLSKSTLEVPANDYATFEVKVVVDPSKLPDWDLNAGTTGGSGPALTKLEYDGFVVVQDAQDTLRLPWHILPRKASDLDVEPQDIGLVGGSGKVTLANLAGAGTTGVSEVFALGGTSPLDYPKPDPFLPYGPNNMAFPDLAAAGIRVIGSNLEVAVATHEERSHPLFPAEFDVYLDVNNDGTDDYILFNADVGFLASSITGRMAVWVYDLDAGAVVGAYPADADLNSSTMIFQVPMGLLGLKEGDPVNWFVVSFDNYFTGSLTDWVIDPVYFYMTHTLGVPRYAVAGTPSPSVPAGGSVELGVSEVLGGGVASPSQEGLLFMHRQAAEGRWWEVVGVSSAAP